MLINPEAHFAQPIADLGRHGQLPDANDRPCRHPTERANGGARTWAFRGLANRGQILFVHGGQRMVRQWLTQDGTARERFQRGENYFAAAWRTGCAGIVATRYCTSELICVSFSGPPSELAKPGIKEPGLPWEIHVRQ